VVVLAAPHLCKQFSQSVCHDTWIVVFTKHRVRLPSSYNQQLTQSRSSAVVAEIADRTALSGIAVVTTLTGAISDMEILHVEFKSLGRCTGLKVVKSRS